MAKWYETTVDDRIDAVRLVERLLRAGEAPEISVLDDRGGNGGVVIKVKMYDKSRPVVAEPVVAGEPRVIAWRDSKPPLTRGD